MTPSHKQVLVLMMASLVALSLAAGCGGGGSVSSGISAPSSEPAGSAPGASKGGKEAALGEAAQAALHHMQDANPGSSYKASETRVCDCWAKVNVQEIGVPSDEALACVIYLRQDAKGAWEVVDSGTDITADDLPEAPEDLFE